MGSSSVKQPDVQISKFRLQFLASLTNIEAINYLKSTENIIREQRRHIQNNNFQYTIHPFSNFKYFWTSMMCVVIYILPIAETFALTFEQKDVSGKPPKDFFIVKIVIIIFGVIGILDMIFGFVTGYWNYKKRMVELVLKEITINNVTSLRFYRNILFNVPSYIIVLIYESIYGHLQYGPSDDNICYTRDYISILTFLKVWRYMDISEFLTKIERFSTYDRTIWKIVNLCMCILALYHMSTCLTMNIFSLTESHIYKAVDQPCHPLDGNAWIICENVMHRYPEYIFGRYFKCLINVASTLALFGEGGKYNNHSVDRIMIVVLRILGMWNALYIINYISVIVRSSFNGERKFQMINGYIEEMSRHKKLPNETKKKMLKYFEYRFDKRFINEQRIMSLLSAQLRNEIITHCRKHIIIDLPYFANLPEEIIYKLAEALHTEIYMPNDIVVKKGSVERALFVLAVGTALTSPGDEIDDMCWKSESGSYFGQMSFIDPDHEAEYSVFASDICEFKLLFRDDYLRIMSPHRNMLNMIEDMLVAEMMY